MTAGVQPDGHPLQVAVQAALSAAFGNQDQPDGVLVAYSGGRDSSVLLHASVAALGAAKVVAVHINHRLQAEADNWQAHAQAFAAELGCQFRCTVASPPMTHPPGGIEAWARAFRRQAFVAHARDLGARAILLAHHADDQVETIVLNLGRGSGPSGMTGMPQVSTLDGIVLLRPFLSCDAGTMAEYAQGHQLSWVEDPSNQDVSFRRNRVRHEVLPLLADVFPGFKGNVLRHAGLMKAQLSHALTPQGSRFDRREYQTQADDELDAMLHRWLRSLQQRAPTQARTRHLREQLFRSDGTYAECQHDDAWLRRYRDVIEWTDTLPTPVTTEMKLKWQGEQAVALPDFGGVLLFREADQGEPGLPTACLTDQALTVSALRMNSSMRVARGGRNRRLRLLCQENGIPKWQRQRLPMLRRETDILFAAELGLNHEMAAYKGPARWRIEFQPGEGAWRALYSRAGSN